jgi:hypothetical protein
LGRGESGRQFDALVARLMLVVLLYVVVAELFAFGGFWIHQTPKPVLYARRLAAT